jgi:4-hydroxy-tetrahydrodipicolinate reductase
VAIIDRDGFTENTKEKLINADVALEFSTPETAFENYLHCFDLGISVVSGTTGWLDRFDEITEICRAKEAGFFYASNFSLGVNLFFEVNRKLARLIAPYQEYEVSIEEIHHIHKKDAPSGTAITLASDIISENKNKSAWVCNAEAKKNEIPIVAKRIDDVPGTHTIIYDSPVDCIEISHRSKNRKGFALGAMLAAEFMKGKKGIFGMKDLLNIAY